MRAIKLLMLSFSGILMFFFANSNTANAEEFDTLSFESEIESALSEEDVELFDQLDKYTYTTSEGTKEFDVAAAKEANASVEVITVGTKMNELLVEYKTNSSSNSAGMITIQGLFPIGSYGNYCGKGNNVGSYPKDNLDRACKYHDKCWNGVFGKNTKCNRAFVRRLLPIVQTTSPLTYKGIYARAAMKLFS